MAEFHISEPTTSGQQHTHPVMPEDARTLGGTIPLRDGRTARIRAIRPEDTERLRAFHASLSPQTIIFRFFYLMRHLPPEQARRFTHVDYDGRMAVLATIGEGAEEQLLSVVRYDRMQPTQAEVAFVVDDSYQGNGIATALLYRLAEYARVRGIETLVAITMGENARMIDVLRDSGFPVSVRHVCGDIEVSLDIRQPPRPSFGAH